jgi:hypothetical protein
MQSRELGVVQLIYDLESRATLECLHALRREKHMRLSTHRDKVLAAIVF